MTNKIERVKLSQWDALLLESLRGLGWSDEQLLAIGSAGELPVDESEYEFDYSALAAFAAEQPELYRSAVQSGYQIKYNTIRGIRSWLNVAFGLEPELTLDEGAEAVTAALTETQQAKLLDVLSYGWHVTESAPGVYRVEPLRS